MRPHAVTEMAGSSSHLAGKEGRVESGSKSRWLRCRAAGAAQEFKDAGLGVDALEGWSASMGRSRSRSRSRAQMTPPTQAARGPQFGKDQGSAGARAE